MEMFRLDASRNDISHPKVSLNAYPAFYFFAAGDKANPIEYDGERSVDAILKFIDTFRRTTSAKVQDQSQSQSQSGSEFSPADRSRVEKEEEQQWSGPKQRTEAT